MKSAWLTRFGLILVILMVVRDHGTAAVLSSARFNEARAMRLWLGNFDEVSGTSAATIPDDAQLGLRDSGLKLGNAIRVHPFWVSGYLEDGAEKVALLTYAVPGTGTFDCHACAPLIGMAVFRQSVGGWNVESSNVVVSRAGAFGVPPPTAVRLMHVGPKKIAVEITEVSQGQGVTARSKLLLVPWKSEVGEAVRIHMEEDDKGACGPRPPHDGPACYKNWKTFRFRLGKDPEYFDILLTLQGTDYSNDGDKIKRVAGVERLRFSDGEYISDFRRGAVTATEQAMKINR